MTDRLEAYRAAIVARQTDPIAEDLAEVERLTIEGDDDRDVCDRCDRPSVELVSTGSWAKPALLCPECMSDLHGNDTNEEAKYG